MLSQKVFEVTVNVRNPINFCSDTARHIAAELQENFVGRCYKGAHIVRVVRVLRHSACRIVTTNSSGRGVIDVEFLADVVVFSKWDILVGMRVVNTAQMLVGEFTDRDNGAQAVITLSASASAAKAAEGAPAPAGLSKAAETLAVGQLVPVRVVLATHPPMQPRAALAAVMLTCDRAAPVWRLRGSLGPESKAELRQLLTAIETELVARAELMRAEQRAHVLFFEALLCAYRRKTPQTAVTESVPTWEGGPAWEGFAALREVPGTKNVLAIAHSVLAGETVPVAGYWSRPLALSRSSPLAASADTPAAEWNAGAAPTPVDSTPQIVFVEYLKNILDFLVAVRQLAATYGTQDLVKAHQNLWHVMGSAQTIV